MGGGRGKNKGEQESKRIKGQVVEQIALNVKDKKCLEEDLKAVKSEILIVVKKTENTHS